MRPTTGCAPMTPYAAQMRLARPPRVRILRRPCQSRKRRNGAGGNRRRSPRRPSARFRATIRDRDQPHNLKCRLTRPDGVTRAALPIPMQTLARLRAGRYLRYRPNPRAQTRISVSWQATLWLFPASWSAAPRRSPARLTGDPCACRPLRRPLWRTRVQPACFDALRPGRPLMRMNVAAAMRTP